MCYGKLIFQSVAEFVESRWIFSLGSSFQPDYFQKLLQFKKLSMKLRYLGIFALIVIHKYP